MYPFHCPLPSHWHHWRHHPPWWLLKPAILLSTVPRCHDGLVVIVVVLHILLLATIIVTIYSTTATSRSTAADHHAQPVIFRNKALMRSRHLVQARHWCHPWLQHMNVLWRAQQVAAFVIKNCPRQVSIITVAAAATHCRRPSPTCPFRPPPRDGVLQRPGANSSNIAITTSGVICNEHGRSLSYKDQGILLVKPAGSTTNTISVIIYAGCPCRRIARRMVVCSHYCNCCRQIPWQGWCSILRWHLSQLLALVGALLASPLPRPSSFMGGSHIIPPCRPAVANDCASPIDGVAFVIGKEDNNDGGAPLPPTPYCHFWRLSWNKDEDEEGSCWQAVTPQ